MMVVNKMGIITKNLAMTDEAVRIIIDYQTKRQISNFATALDVFIKEYGDKVDQ